MQYAPKIRGKHVRLGNFGVNACRMAAFSGFKESHEPPLSGNVWGIVLVHPPSKWPAKGGVFCILILFAVLWRPPGRYGASSHPMAALSGFYKNPGLPPLVDAIAPPWLSIWHSFAVAASFI